LIGVLHTWGRDLSYHPHVHYILAGGALSSDNRWVPSSKKFFVPVKALSTIFRAKIRDGLEELGLLSSADQKTMGCPFQTRSLRGCGTKVSCSVCLSWCPLQQSHRTCLRHISYLPLPGIRFRDPASNDPYPDGVHPKVSPACPPGRLSQSQILRPPESFKPKNAQAHSKYSGNRFLPGSNLDPVGIRKTRLPRNTAIPPLRTLRLYSEADQNSEERPHQGATMKRRANPQEIIRTRAENSSFPSTPSCALMLPISPCNNTAACKRSSLSNAEDREFAFSSIPQHVKSHPDGVLWPDFQSL